MVAPRANWKGFIKFGEVSCPVALYTAASSSERIAFNTLNRKTGNRVRREFVDSETANPSSATTRSKATRSRTADMSSSSRTKSRPPFPRATRR
jgi:non-homologous end joining protein Ku